MIWDSSLFVRRADGVAILPNSSEYNELPKIVDKKTFEPVENLATAISNVGKAGISLTIILIFFGYSMNVILSQVRSLSIITHLMIMNLNYPETATIFYSKIFEFVTFDLLASYFPKVEEFL